MKNYYWMNTLNNFDYSDLRNWECRFLFLKWQPKKLWEKDRGNVIVENGKTWDTTIKCDLPRCYDFTAEANSILMVSPELFRKLKALDK